MQKPFSRRRHRSREEIATILSTFDRSGQSAVAWEKQWRETNPGGLPAKIPGIVRELEREASTIAKLVEEAEHQAKLERQRWEEERREQDLRDAERLRVKNIEASREQLFTIIKAWGVAKRIEGFFEDAERRA